MSCLDKARIQDTLLPTVQKCDTALATLARALDEIDGLPFVGHGRERDFLLVMEGLQDARRTVILASERLKLIALS